jgi:hypothetical protein
MELRPHAPPRTFTLGNVTIAHVADVDLRADEQITFTSAAGTELDVVRKSWGYYATSSNRRLREHGLRMALCANDDGRVALLLVEAGHEAAFAAYVDVQPMRLVAWLDTDEAAADALRRLEA